MSENNRHDTDAAGERDLTREAEVIKLTLDQQKATPQRTATIPFTSLAESKIPGLAMSKILGNAMNVSYIPDTYFVLDLAQRLFIRAKQDKSLKRIDEVNIFSFTLYTSYALMYSIFSVIQEVNPIPGYDLTPVLTVFRSAGFGTIRLPAFMSYWISGLGKFTDPETKKNFLPSLPVPQTTGTSFNEYFWSDATTHLLPNFRGIMGLMMLHLDPATLTIAPAHRTRDMFLGNDFTGIAALANTYIARSNTYRLPGMENLLRTVTDNPLFNELLRVSLAPAPPNAIERYLMLDSNLLSHLNTAIQPLFEHIDCITVNAISAIGTSMCMITLQHTPYQNTIIPGKNVPSAQGTAQIIYESRPSMDCRLISRFEIINGNADYASQTPIVRVADTAMAPIIPGYLFADPQPSWYTTEIEFRSPVFTMDESHSYFERK